MSEPAVKEPVVGSRRRVMWLVGAALLVAAALAAYLIWGGTPRSGDKPRSGEKPRTEAPGGEAPAVPDPEALIGRWVRPDGGYVLQVSASTPDGRLEAAYFNPRPINVARAEWKLQDGRLGVFVELRDVGYDGSTYTLTYDPATDRLTGVYFLASRNEKFEIWFQRAR